MQRKTARKDSVRQKGYVMAPPGGLAGRFDLADSPETALYESLFRREVRSCHLSRIEQRALVSFETVSALRLVDLRGLEAHYPVLQSMRYETSQTFAQACRQQGLHGVLYASAQHPSHSCVCLFGAGIERTKKLDAAALVQSQAPAYCTKQWCWRCVGRKCRFCGSDVASILIAFCAINTRAKA